MQAAQLQRQDSLQRASSFGAPARTARASTCHSTPPPRHRRGCPGRTPRTASGYPRPPSPHAGHQYRAPIPAQPQMPYGAGRLSPAPAARVTHGPAAPWIRRARRAAAYCNSNRRARAVRYS